MINFRVLTGCDFIVALGESLVLLCSKCKLGFLELFAEQIGLVFSHFRFQSLVPVPFLVDVVGNLTDLTLALFDGSVELHRVLCGVLQGLLQVRDLTGQLALGGAVFCVLLLDLWQVLELDCLPLEHALFHFLNVFLLLLPQNIVSQLHSVDFLLHRNDISLSNCGV